MQGTLKFPVCGKNIGSSAVCGFNTALQNSINFGEICGNSMPSWPCVGDDSVMAFNIGGSVSGRLEPLSSRCMLSLTSPNDATACWMYANESLRCVGIYFGLCKQFTDHTPPRTPSFGRAYFAFLSSSSLARFFPGLHRSQQVPFDLLASFQQRRSQHCTRSHAQQCLPAR